MNIINWIKNLFKRGIFDLGYYQLLKQKGIRVY